MMSLPPEPVRIVQEWHDALNRRDVARVMALSSDDVEVGGPRGSGQGVEVMRDWLARSGVTIEPVSLFHRDDTVVVEQRLTWAGPGTDVEPESQIHASVFVLDNGRIKSIVRHRSLAVALEAGGLSEHDRIS